MQCIKAYESLTVDAAVNGDREKGFQALLENPLLPNAMGCRAVLDDVLDVVIVLEVTRARSDYTPLKLVNMR